MTEPHVTHRLAAAVPSAGRLQVRNPFDLSVIAKVDVVDRAGVDAALRVAIGLFRDRDAWLPAHARVAILQRTAELMRERAEWLATEATHEGGKPLSDSRIEIARAIDGIHNCAELLRNERGAQVPMGATAASAGRLAFTTHEPIGPVVAISAFNHPLNLVVHQVGPAVAAGCPVIIKPAEETPLSCFHFIDLLREAGLPAGWAQALITDEIATAEALATDPRVALLTFIGSARVGWHLRSRIAPGTRCTLEHGGVAPVIVDRRVDLDEVVPALAKGGFYHAGQVCVSVQRVFADRVIAEPLAQALAGAGLSMRVGNPLSEATDIGPLIRPAETERVHAWVQEAVHGGARLLCGGDTLTETCYAPTVLVDPPDGARVSTQEIFGPVIAVYHYDDLDRAIQRANALPYAFQAAVFTKDLGTALRAATRLDASAVMINDHTAFRVDWMPFAGLRQSGLGTGGIPYSFREMQIEKMLVLRSTGL
ncbi:aldehyde dehydrogenase [Thiocapsa imhoffii]|uniref:Aldehyde dehydrogenase n=1 Tax=Thiocapsa imhoffii TaxID=382777 RepID=A0A9X0WFG5_9GAMM|nr:aldehyde dehydrogenase family protein [Thiocapsa imhoffii]MBK1643620.1 aldehyde dehydrogenase [Thiocapsa imhoffii]